MSAEDRIKGWCPGVWRPMESGDGLIVRVRITGGILSPDRARALAEAARTLGNGQIDLSNRANLQIRGVSDATLPRLQAVLAGLGLLDPDPQTESVRNVIASPLAGVDPTLAIDVVAATKALEAALVEAVDLRTLPAKFGFLIDGGGALPLDGVSVDVAFVAVGKGVLRVLAGGVPTGHIREKALVPEALRLARLYLAARHPDERRMAPFARRMGEALASPNHAVEAAEPVQIAPMSPARHSLAAAPFGRLSADQLHGLAALANSYGTDLRLTPWRAIVLPVRVPEKDIRALGLLPGLDEPVMRIAACPGAPACRSGEAQTQAAALRLAAALGPQLTQGVSLHVSGCPKGCARQAPATVSLTAEAGRFALAFDAAAGDPRATGLLDIEAAADLIRERLKARAASSEFADA